MADTTLSGPVISETGFRNVTVNRFGNFPSGATTNDLYGVGAPTPMLYAQYWAAPATSDLDQIIAAGTTGPNTTTLTFGTGGTAFAVGSSSFLAGVRLDSGTQYTLEHARNIILTWSAAPTGNITMVVTGADIRGTVRTETISLTAGGSATGTGVKAFKTITKITVASDANDSGKTFKVGHGVALGLDLICGTGFVQARDVFIENVDNISATTRGTFVAGSATTTLDPRGTWTFNSAPNGTRNYLLVYMPDNVTQYGLHSS